VDKWLLAEVAVWARYYLVEGEEACFFPDGSRGPVGVTSWTKGGQEEGWPGAGV